MSKVYVFRQYKIKAHTCSNSVACSGLSRLLGMLRHFIKSGKPITVCWSLKYMSRIYINVIKDLITDSFTFLYLK